MSWVAYLGFIVVFTLGFMILYGLVYSLVSGFRDNYFRHYQKAELQWTGPRARVFPKKIGLAWLVLSSLVTAWIVVECAI